MEKLHFTNTDSDGVPTTEELTLTVDEERYTLTVSDNGVADPPNEEVREFLLESDDYAVEPVQSAAEQTSTQVDANGNDPLVETDPEQLSEAQRLIDGADYRTLQDVAGEFDDIAGNQSESDLRVELHTEASESEIVEAFGTVVAREADEDGADTEATE